MSLDCNIYTYIYNTVIHRIWAVLQSDWLNYSSYISSYTASSEKQDGGPKTTWNNILKQQRKTETCSLDIENINCSEKFTTKDKWICSQQALTSLPNTCIIYMSFSVRFTGSKTISFTSSSSCKTKVFQIFMAKRFLAAQIVKTL
jgi:hypothetical protein